MNWRLESIHWLVGFLLFRDALTVRRNGWWETHEVQKGRCEVLPVWWNNPMQQAGASWMKFGFAQEDFRVLVDSKLNQSQQYALIIKKTDQILGCIITNVASMSKKYCLYLSPARTDSVVYRFRLSSRRKTLMHLSKASRCLLTWSGVLHIWSMRGLRELDLFGLGKKRLRGAVYRRLTGGYEEDRTSILEVCSDRTRDHGHKQQPEKFCLYIWKKSHSGGNQTLEQAAHKVCGISILGSI